MKITVKNPNNENSLTFNEVEYKEYLYLLDLCKKEKYTMIIELVDEWD